MYDEIDVMLPIFKSLLSQRKQGTKTLMGSLRQSVSQTENRDKVPPSELDAYTKKFYDWLDPRQRSAIRLCMHWQASSVLLLIFALVKYEFSKCKAMLFCGQCSSRARQLGV